MAKFIELTLIGGGSVLLNTLHITDILKKGAGTMISLSNDSDYFYTVQESYEEIKKMLGVNDD